jgi:hypothetical protein
LTINDKAGHVTIAWIFNLHRKWHAGGFSNPLKMLRYFAALSTGRLVLWCYLIWYVCMVSLFFEPSPVLWISSVGMSGIIGPALLLSTSGNGSRPDGWTIFRLFLMPLCVSSYSALIKGKGFILIFPPGWRENFIGLGCVVAFLVTQRILKSAGAAADPEKRSNHGSA